MSDLYSTDLSDEEKALLKQYAESQNAGGFGSLVGSGLGMLAGGITGLATGGALSPALMAAGGSIGGSLGGLIGGQVGASQGESALKRLQALREAREAPAIEKQARAEAFERLLGRYNKYGV